MRVGSLYNRITIQRATLVDDGWGSVEEWHDWFTTWASAVQQGGREFFAAATVQAVKRVVFRIRYRPGLTPRDRIIHEGVIHDIKDVRVIGRASGIELHTVAVAN